MPRKSSNKQVQIEMSPAQHKALKRWQARRGHRSLAAAIRELCADALARDEIEFPDDLGDWGDPDRLHDRPDHE